MRIHLFHREESQSGRSLVKLGVVVPAGEEEEEEEAQENQFRINSKKKKERKRKRKFLI